jgi:hypothetical protein
MLFSLMTSFCVYTVITVSWMELHQIKMCNSMSGNESRSLGKLWCVCCAQTYFSTCFREKLLEWIKFTQSNTKWVKFASRPTKFRTEGNKKFVKCDNAGNLALYTDSVVHAPRKSKFTSSKDTFKHSALLLVTVHRIDRPHLFSLLTKNDICHLHRSMKPYMHFMKSINSRGTVSLHSHFFSSIWLI